MNALQPGLGNYAQAINLVVVIPVIAVIRQRLHLILSQYLTELLITENAERAVVATIAHHSI
ncbi:hypothetical protein EC465_17845 [Salmonella enterica subsp. enterica serovar Muenchen]|nr:hypothetical protein [Salmonella enterica subsp. enterica serovar Muenchen]